MAICIDRDLFSLSKQALMELAVEPEDNCTCRGHTVCVLRMRVDWSLSGNISCDETAGFIPDKSRLLGTVVCHLRVGIGAVVAGTTPIGFFFTEPETPLRLTDPVGVTDIATVDLFEGTLGFDPANPPDLRCTPVIEPFFIGAGLLKLSQGIGQQDCGSGWTATVSLVSRIQLSDPCKSWQTWELLLDGIVECPNCPSE